MVDFDIFKATVPPAWCRAARHVFGPELTELAVDEVQKAAAITFRKRGCAGLPEFVEILSGIKAAAGDQSPSSVLNDIEEVERCYLDDLTPAAANVMRWLSACAEYDPRSLEQVDDLAFAEQVIIEVGLQSLSAPKLWSELQARGGRSAIDLEERRAEIRTRWSQSSGPRKLAGELLDDPTGAAIKLPKPRRKKTRQEELLTKFVLTH